MKLPIAKTSVTRLSEILALRQNHQSLGQFVEGLFTISQNFKPTRAKFFAIGQDIVDENGQMLNNNLAIWSHWPKLSIGTVV